MRGSIRLKKMAVSMCVIKGYKSCIITER